MRDKDTELLEEAYNNVLLSELNWRGAAAGLALGALGAGNAQASSEKYPQDMDGAAIESITNPELGAEESVDKIINILNQNKSIREIIESEPQLLKSVAEDIKKGNHDLAKRLTHILQLKQQPLPKFLLPYKQDMTPVGP